MVFESFELGEPAGASELRAIVPSMVSKRTQWGVKAVVDSDDASVVGGPVDGGGNLGMVSLTPPLEPRPLIASIDQLHPQSNRDVKCMMYSLTWARGAQKDALVHDVNLLGALSEVCTCHGRRGDRGGPAGRGA